MGQGGRREGGGRERGGEGADFSPECVGSGRRRKNEGEES